MGQLNKLENYPHEFENKYSSVTSNFISIIQNTNMPSEKERNKSLSTRPKKTHKIKSMNWPQDKSLQIVNYN